MRRHPADVVTHDEEDVGFGIMGLYPRKGGVDLSQQLRRLRSVDSPPRVAFGFPLLRGERPHQRRLRGRLAFRDHRQGFLGPHLPLAE
jgi:hypothetical protein